MTARDKKKLLNKIVQMSTVEVLHAHTTVGMFCTVISGSRTTYCRTFRHNN